MTSLLQVVAGCFLTCNILKPSQTVLLQVLQVLQVISKHTYTRAHVRGDLKKVAIPATPATGGSQRGLKMLQVHAQPATNLQQVVISC